MAVIKSGISPAVLDRKSYELSDFESQKEGYFREIKAQAEKMLLEARQKARETLDKARQDGLKKAAEEAEKSRVQAEKRGYDEGLKKGGEAGEKAVQEKIRSEITPLAEALTKALASFEEEKRKLLQRAEAGLVKTAFVLAKKIILVESACNSAVIAAQLAKALEVLNSTCGLEIRVHPDDLAVAKSHLPALLAERGENPAVVWKSDPSVGRAGCVVSSGEAQLDSRLEGEWERLLSAVSEAVGKAAGEKAAGMAAGSS